MNAAQAEIYRLQNEIDSTLAVQNSIKISSYNEQINSNISLLSQVYNLYNAEKEVIQQIGDNITKEQNALNSLQADIQSHKANIISK